MKSLSLSTPHVLIMVGIPGSGKTFFAAKFAETFHAPYVASEKILAFLPDNPEAAETLTNYQLDELLKTHQSIIYEGDTASRVKRIELAKKARSAGYETLIIWVQTDQPTAQARTAKTAKDKGLSQSEEDYEKLLKRFTAPAAPEKPVVISGRHTYASQAKVVLQRLTTARTALSTQAAPPARPEPRRNITIR